MPVVRNLRWYVAVLLCCSTVINYLDRQTFPVLSSTIQRELGFSDVAYADITSAFLTTYMVMYAVGGRLMDVLGTRRGLTLFVSGWSLSEMLNAIARSAGQLAVFRALLGITEAPNIPGGIKAVTEWFPVRERALAVGIFNAGTAIGAAAAVPVVTTLALGFGWRSAFVVTGLLGLVWVIVWAAFYRLPDQHRWLGADERALILEGRPPGALRPPPIARLLGMRETWGCIAARMLTDPISYFFVFWVPKYLQDVRGFSLVDLRNAGWIPFVGQALGNIASGAIPRALVARGWSLDRARKVTMLVMALGIPALCLTVARAERPSVAVAALTAWMFAHAAWGNVILPTEVFPARAVGTVTGMAGALGAMVGAATQRLIAGVPFPIVFAVCAGAYIVGLALVAVLVPDLGRVRAVPEG